MKILKQFSILLSLAFAGAASANLRIMMRSSTVSPDYNQGGVVERSAETSTRWDGQIAIDQSADTFYSVSLEGGSPPPFRSRPSAPPVNLGVRFSFQPSGEPNKITIDSSMPQSSSLVTESLNAIATLLPQVQNFAQSMERLEAQREAIQQRFDQARVQNQAQYQALMAEAERIRQRAEANNPSLGLMQFTSALLQAGGSVSPESREARERAAQIARDPFRFSAYEFESADKARLEAQLERAMQSQDYAEASKVAEMLSHGKINGNAVSSQILNRHVSQSGVLKVPLGGPLADLQLKTQSRSEQRQVVQRIANQYQAIWQETSGLRFAQEQTKARYTMGVAALTLGDELLAEGKSQAGSAMLRLAQVMADSTSGLAAGVVNSISDLAQSIPALAKLGRDGIQLLFSNPQAAWDQTAKFVLNIDKVGGAIINSIARDWDTLSQGNAFERAEVIGRYSVDVVMAVATGGTTAVTARGSTIAARLSQSANRLGSIVGRTSAFGESAALQSYVHLARGMPQGARVALTQIQRHPTLAAEYGTQLARFNLAGNVPTTTYVQRLALAEGRGIAPGQVQRVAEFHSEIYSKMGSVRGIDYQTNVVRGIPRTHQGITNSVDDTFRVFPGNLPSEHRFTIGGEMGHAGLYVTEGVDSSAMRTFLAQETGFPSNQLLVGQQNLTLRNVLDLTDESVLNQLGYTRDIFRNEILGPNAYSSSQALGDAAKARGFSGLRVPSAVDGGRTNVIIF